LSKNNVFPQIYTDEGLEMGKYFRRRAGDSVLRCSSKTIYRILNRGGLCAQQLMKHAFLWGYKLHTRVWLHPQSFSSAIAEPDGSLMRRGGVEGIVCADGSDLSPTRKRGMESLASLALQASMAAAKTAHFRPRELYMAGRG
jgi:hypothetical protein